MAAMDEDVSIESVTNSPAAVSRNDTPQSSNPGTPRSEQETVNTPPVPAPQPKHIHAPLAIPPMPQQPQSKYGNLLAVIEDLGKDIRPTYAGNRTSAERLKRGIVHARILVRECLMECERNART